MTTTEIAPKVTGAAAPETVRFTLPLLGTIEMSTRELVFVGGIAALGLFGFLDLPIALVLAGGHVLAADRSHQNLRDLGAAMEEAG